MTMSLPSSKFDTNLRTLSLIRLNNETSAPPEGFTVSPGLKFTARLLQRRLQVHDHEYFVNLKSNQGSTPNRKTWQGAYETNSLGTCALGEKRQPVYLVWA
ncbi:hypothetical protein TNCV_2514802 [Trichonephila clavipes]|nr:hypothetical protein TNCV_2514802 [Trichonephila clavipes]